MIFGELCGHLFTPPSEIDPGFNSRSSSSILPPHLFSFPTFHSTVLHTKALDFIANTITVCFLPTESLVLVIQIPVHQSFTTTENGPCILLFLTSKALSSKRAPQGTHNTLPTSPFQSSLSQRQSLTDLLHRQRSSGRISDARGLIIKRTRPRRI